LDKQGEHGCEISMGSVEWEAISITGPRRGAYQIGQDAGSASILHRLLVKFMFIGLEHLFGENLVYKVSYNPTSLHSFTVIHLLSSKWPTSGGGPLPDLIQYQQQVQSLL
jgi:hypothetical protein